MAKKSEIGGIASTLTKADFAEKLSSYTMLTSREIEDLFPQKSDREELVELIQIVNSSADENGKKAELVQKIGSVSSVVIKLTKKFVIGL